MGGQNVIVDISDYQKGVDFQKARKQIRAVIIKATQGVSKKQKHFAARRELARAAGLYVGSYHFGEQADGREQADYYLATCNPRPDEVMALDFEEWSSGGKPQPAMTLKQARDFVQRVHEVTGRWPGLYGGSYLKEQLGSSTDPILGRCWLWIAQYGPKAKWPKQVWPYWTIWQYTGDGKGPEPHDADGIGKNIDRDIFVGSLDELDNFWKSGGIERPALTKDFTPIAREEPHMESPESFFNSAIDKLASLEESARRETPLFFPQGIQYFELDVTLPGSVKLIVSGDPKPLVHAAAEIGHKAAPLDLVAEFEEANLDEAGAPTEEERNAVNFGLDGRGDFPEGDKGLFLPDAKGPFHIALDIDKAKAFLNACVTSTPRVRYGYGKKIKPGQIPGKDFQSVDCSGLVRELVRRSTSLGSTFPDGSVVQHDWVRKKGFVKTNWDDGTSNDDIVRIAFLSPNDVSSGIGHVQLLYRNMTLESHGGVGPNSRKWSILGFSKKMSVYRLTN